MQDLELDELITRYSFEAEILDMFIASGENKGEVCLMFSLLEIERSEEENKKLISLLQKFCKNENEDVRDAAESFLTMA